MRPALWLVGATVAVLAIVSACTGWGDAPDPGATTTETISNILQLPGGATLEHVGQVVADDSVLYASATSRGDDYSATYWLLRKAPGEGSWSTISATKNGSEPRLLATNGTLFWAGRDAGNTRVRAWSPGDSSPRELCTLSYGPPAGIAWSGKSLYVLLTSSSCEYSFDTDKLCDSADANAELWECPTLGDAGSASEPVRLLDGRELLSNQIQEALQIQDRSLYWFERAVSAGGYKGAALMQLPIEGLDGGTPAAPAAAMSLDANSYPLGFALSLSTGDWFVASSAAVAPDSSSYSGCTIWRLKKGTSEPQVVMTDPARTCRGMSADPANVVVTTSWLDGAEQRDGVMLLKLGATAFPPAFEVKRRGIGLRETILFQDSVLVRAPGALLRIPLKLVP